MVGLDRHFKPHFPGASFYVSATKPAEGSRALREHLGEQNRVRLDTARPLRQRGMLPWHVWHLRLGPSLDTNSMPASTLRRSVSRFWPRPRSHSIEQHTP